MTNASSADRSRKRTGWSTPIKLGPALAGDPPPSPRVGRWTDIDSEGESIARALFYPNEVHSVFGEPESMKSWLMLHATAEELNAGCRTFYVDMEANQHSIVDRLRLLGVSPRRIKGGLLYFRPDEPINEADANRLASLVAKRQPTLVVLDGVTEAFAMNGLSINSSEDSAIWFRRFSRQLQVEPSGDYLGPAIVELDHVVKSQEGRGGWALGSQHKKAGIKGSAYQVAAVRPFAKGKHGVSRLFLEKDSPGAIDWSPHGQRRQRLVAELHCDSTPDQVVAWLETPEPAASVAVEEIPLAQSPKFRNRMHEVWKYVSDHPGCGVRSIRIGVAGGDAEKRSAIEQLVVEGFLRNQGGTARHEYVAVGVFEPLRGVPK